MLDRSEQDRLGVIYGELRDRLLDLTKKNRALTYTFSTRSGEPPTSETVVSIAGLDPARLERAVTLQEEHLTAERAVDALDWPQHADATKLASVPALVAALPNGELASLSPSALRRHAEATIARDSRFLDVAEPLRPALTVMGLDASQSCRSLDAVCAAAGIMAQIVEKVPASNLVWLSADIDADAFDRLHARWEKHSAEEHDLRLLTPEYTEDRWPDHRSRRRNGRAYLWRRPGNARGKAAWHRQDWRQRPESDQGGRRAALPSKP